MTLETRAMGIGPFMPGDKGDTEDAVAVVLKVVEVDDDGDSIDEHGKVMCRGRRLALVRSKAIGRRSANRAEVGRLDRKIDGERGTSEVGESRRTTDSPKTLPVVQPVVPSAPMVRDRVLTSVPSTVLHGRGVLIASATPKLKLAKVGEVSPISPLNVDPVGDTTGLGAGP